MRKTNLQEFKDKANRKHNNFYSYDFSQITQGIMHPVEITCPKHGNFKQRGDHHLAGSGCKKCMGEMISKNQTMDAEHFFEKCKIIHKNKYDYSKSQYITARKKILVICPIHGEFAQVAFMHKKGAQCPRCARIQTSDQQKMSVDEFKSRAAKVHNSLYDYSLIQECKNIQEKLPIICMKHGVFLQNGCNHIHSRKGCPACNTYSKMEKYITRILIDNNISFTYQKSFNDFRSPEHGRLYRFDYYLEDLNIMLEYDGKHHHESIPYWGGEKYLQKIQKTDILKNEYCEKNNITLHRITYKENINHRLKTILPELVI